MKTEEEINKKIMDLTSELGQLEQTAENVSTHKRISIEIRTLAWALGADDNGTR